MKIKIKKKNNSGTTLIEALTLIFIFSVIIVTFYQVFTIGTRYIIDSKNRLGAVALVGEKMEIIRNLNYEDIGTDTGTVSGDIPELEDVIANSRLYHVTTTVDYVEDNYDNLFPTDTAPEDYKKVIVTATWGGGIGDASVSASSTFVPKGLEVANPGNGILAVNVISDQAGGVGVASSSVHIENSDTGLNTTRTTDGTGSVVFMGDRVTDSIQKYKITVTKAGYETVATMDPYPISLYNPAFLHASVVTGTINVKNIIQNELADLVVKTVDYLDQPISDIDFTLVGGKKIGNDVLPPNGPIYNFNETSVTDSEGEKEYSGISPGTFTFTLSPLVLNYELIGTNPPSPFALPSDPALDFKVILAKKDFSSALVRVVRLDDGTPIVGAQVKLSNSLGYDVTLASSYNGSAFFPATSDPFAAGTYDLEVTSDGYTSSNSQIIVNSNELKVETVQLNAS